MVDDALVAELDHRVGRGRRSAYVAKFIRDALDDAQRWDDVQSGFGSIGWRLTKAAISDTECDRRFTFTG